MYFFLVYFFFPVYDTCIFCILYIIPVPPPECTHVGFPRPIRHSLCIPIQSNLTGDDDIHASAKPRLSPLEPASEEIPETRLWLHAGPRYAPEVRTLYSTCSTAPIYNRTYIRGGEFFFFLLSPGDPVFAGRKIQTCSSRRNDLVNRSATASQWYVCRRDPG